MDGTEWTAQDARALREEIIPMRDKCLDLKNFDASGAVVLSHALKALYAFADMLNTIEQHRTTEAHDILVALLKEHIMDDATHVVTAAGRCDCLACRTHEALQGLAVEKEVPGCGE